MPGRGTPRARQLRALPMSLYSCKYQVKPLHDFLLSAAIFVAAARDIREHPSTSDDTGSSRRNAMHCAQRSLNLGGKELCSTVAAAIDVDAHPSVASDDVIMLARLPPRSESTKR